jgi:hypothetical protein
MLLARLLAANFALLPFQSHAGTPAARPAAKPIPRAFLLAPFLWQAIPATMAAVIVPNVKERFTCTVRVLAASLA